jgi:DNA repair and recombination protein RAD54B
LIAREANKDGICPVVLDPSLYKKMRPHQKEGVQFLYKCVTESVVLQRGAILADDMGLGKSLQTIALLETLLKQGPQGVPTVKKALIVAPSSLLDNWRAEILKWVGEASTVKAIILGTSSSTASKQEQEKKQTLLDFKFGRLYNIGIISYETLRKYAGELSGSIDILVADEGHRIKSASGNKTIDALVMASKNSRRVLLSGTPLQNNLSELYAMCDYVRPGMLGTYASFQNVFAGPIEKSRDKNAKEEAKVLGAARLEELKSMLTPFMLRRSAEVNRAYLPRLSSYAVFCRPSDRQVSMIKDILLRRWHSDMYVGDEALVLLGELRKVCGHPVLLGGEREEIPPAAGGNHACSAGPAGSRSAIDGAAALEALDAPNSAASGKMETALGLMDRIVSGLGERVVVVSQWTSMLNVLESAIKKRGFSTARLDGSTPVAKRQDIVNAFNNNGIGQVFLLSTQAGGVGLNLIGANRLILYDSHWNPALDSQAMARIWRDGQTKQCYIYRMITTGTVDEKIYQRQMMKGQLARCCVMAESTTTEAANASKGKKEGGSFTKEELKELFKIKVGVSCMTADQLQSSGSTYVDDKDAEDSVIREARRSGLPISFVFNERPQDEKLRDDVLARAEEVAEDSSDGDLHVSDDF